MERPAETTDQSKRPFSVAIVSVYLLSVGVWLLITGQIRLPNFGKVVLSRLRTPYRGELREGDIRKEEGVAFVATVPSRLLSDKEAASALLLYEDGRLLGPPHSRHDEIRNVGRGRFSHWGSELYFSASDNSDPRTNQRKYFVAETR